MCSEDDIRALLALIEEVDPDPVDEFEDLLARLVGCQRHTRLPYDDWRPVRVRAIEAAGSVADGVVPQVVAILEERSS